MSGVPVVDGLTAFLEAQDQGNVPLWRVVEVGGKLKEKGFAFLSQRANDSASRAPRAEELDPVALDQVFADMV